MQPEISYPKVPQSPTIPDKKPSQLGLFSIIFGLVSIVASPSVVSLFTNSRIVCTFVIISGICALIGLMMGVMVAKKDKKGLIGLILSIVGILMTVVPVLYVWAAPA